MKNKPACELMSCWLAGYARAGEVIVVTEVIYRGGDIATMVDDAMTAEALAVGES